jgi:hypothetical protein
MDHKKKNEPNEQNEFVQPGLDPKRTGKPVQSYPPNDPTKDHKKEPAKEHPEQHRPGR